MYICPHTDARIACMYIFSHAHACMCPHRTILNPLYVSLYSCMHVLMHACVLIVPLYSIYMCVLICMHALMHACVLIGPLYSIYVCPYTHACMCPHRTTMYELSVLILMLACIKQAYKATAYVSSESHYATINVSSS